MQPRDIPLEPRASLGEVVAGRARIVGSRTKVGRLDLGLPPGVISPYEVRARMGLRYGDPPIEEARYHQRRTRLADAAILARWAFVQLMPQPAGVTATTVQVLSAKVDSLDTAHVISTVMGWLAEGRGGKVFFVHPHALNVAQRDEQLRQDLDNADLVLPDGIGIRIAAHMLGAALPANVNGTDLVPELLSQLAADRVRVALIGGAPGIAARACETWQKRSPFPVAGIWDGYQSEAQYEAIASEIAREGPVLVLIGFGSPLQERFACKYFADHPKVVCITVGGLFDFAAGAKPRAPLAWRELGLEWVWRLVHEPKRLGRRYLLGNPEFLLRVLLQRALPSRRRSGNAM